MDKYRIIVDNIRATVISLSCEDMRRETASADGTPLRSLLSRHTPSGISLAVYPSAECDLALLGAFCEGGLCLELPRAETLLIFSAFWKLVRGLPSTELEVEVSGERVSLEIFDTPRDLVAARLEKCKLLLSFFAEIDAAVTVPMADASVFGSTVRMILGDSPSAIAERSLRASRIIRGRPDAALASVLCTESPEQLRIYSPYPTRISAVAAAAAYLYAVGEYGFDEAIDFGSGLTARKSGFSGVTVECRCQRALSP